MYEIHLDGSTVQLCKFANNAHTILATVTDSEITEPDTIRIEVDTIQTPLGPKTVIKGYVNDVEVSRATDTGPIGDMDIEGLKVDEYDPDQD